MCSSSVPWDLEGCDDRKGGGNHGDHRIHRQFSPFDAQVTKSNPVSFMAQIPDMDFAVAELNSMPHHTPPNRDIPSILIGHIHRPNIDLPEPDWDQLLQYFLTDHAMNGLGNLADLYVFMTRVVLPNTIIDNRNMMIRLYIARPDLDAAFPLRFEHWETTQMGRAIPDNISYEQYRPPTPGALIQPVSTRSIFRSQSNPDGAEFVKWLWSNPALPRGQPLPVQMNHRHTEIDTYLGDEEVWIRQLPSRTLVRRLTRVFHIFWFICGANSRLQRGQDHQ